MDMLYLRTGISPTISATSNLDARPTPSPFSFNHPFRSLFPGAKQGMGIKGVALDDAVSVEVKETKNKTRLCNDGINLDEIQKMGNESAPGSSNCEESETCDCIYDEDEVDFDRTSFSKLLNKVSLAQAKLYAQMSHLGSLAYDIPNIKSGNLLKRHGFEFVTSSIEKREQLANADSNEPEEEEIDPIENQGPRISAAAAFQTLASAASYLNARTRNIFVSSKAESESIGDMASVTSVVAAKEEVKQAVADDLNSVSSSPCEWYICDDQDSATRFFVIQGSETLASWQANLLFEPVQFEGTDIMVHRGIYEAAKGMYKQMLPEINAHMKAYGSRARLRFTGHSLGGSLSLLINLMLLIRGESSVSSLLPVITFGSPTILCGGDELLRKLGLPKSHVQAVIMHRDIVPRAFSCNYPDHVAEFLKAVNGNFRNHPCLNSLKLLYAPMGEMIILQPDANYSPQHHLLPSGSGLYFFTTEADQNHLRSAKLAFLNSPHPLEILSDRSAYGNKGTIQRDHDMSSYLKCVRSVIRRELAQLRRAQRERKGDIWWALALPRVIQGSGIKRFTRLVASHHVHLLVVLLFPARWLLVNAFLFK